MPPILDDGRARVDLGRLVARFAEKHVAHGLYGHAAAARKHARRQFAQAAEALEVVGVFGIGQPRLGDELHLHGGAHPFKAVVDAFAPRQKRRQVIGRAQVVRGAGRGGRAAPSTGRARRQSAAKGGVHRLRRGAYEQRAFLRPARPTGRAPISPALEAALPA